MRVSGLGAFLVVAALGVSQAQAGTIYVYGSGPADERVADVDGQQGSFSTDHGNGNFIAVFAGRFFVDVTDTTGLASLASDSFVAYCVEVASSITVPGTYNATEAPITGGPGGSQPTAGAAWLYNKFAGILTTADQFAALQLAIWEAIFDFATIEGTAGDVTAGQFQVQGFSATVTALANSYLSGLGSSLDAVRLVLTNTSTGANVQDLLGPRIPEPTTLLLFGAGLLGLAAARRRPLR